ncbi:hypothetical protein PSEUDO9AZ_10917 [Pseudomonas sp. 9AZ]|nr:hypothetical protein PSEUDO9AZ_10917 [Pseudomonas sp. 9AZ]
MVVLIILQGSCELLDGRVNKIDRKPKGGSKTIY